MVIIRFGLLGSGVLSITRVAAAIIPKHADSLAGSVSLVRIVPVLDLIRSGHEHGELPSLRARVESTRMGVQTALPFPTTSFGVGV